VPRLAATLMRVKKRSRGLNYGSNKVRFINPVPAGARIRLRQQWRELFREWDVVLCPTMPTPAFAHDHSTERDQRVIGIDGKDYPYEDQMVWPGVATVAGLPATAAPIEISASGLPVGVQLVGPWLEDHTTITFAALLEHEFGMTVAHRRLRLPALASQVAGVADALLQAMGRYQQEVHVLSEMSQTIACSIARAEHELGYDPRIELEEGMRRSIRWCLEQGQTI